MKKASLRKLADYAPPVPETPRDFILRTVNGDFIHALAKMEPAVDLALQLVSRRKHPKVRLFKKMDQGEGEKEYLLSEYVPRS